MPARAGITSSRQLSPSERTADSPPLPLKLDQSGPQPLSSFVRSRDAPSQVQTARQFSRSTNRDGDQASPAHWPLPRRADADRMFATPPLLLHMVDCPFRSIPGDQESKHRLDSTRSPPC